MLKIMLLFRNPAAGALPDTGLAGGLVVMRKVIRFFAAADTFPPAGIAKHFVFVPVAE